MCDNNFDQNVASAICSFQGYTGDDSEWSSGQKWDIQYSYSITLDNLNCPSTYWSSCTYSEYPNCDHSEDVFLTCYDASLGKVSIFCDFELTLDFQSIRRTLLQICVPTNIKSLKFKSSTAL